MPSGHQAFETSGGQVVKVIRILAGILVTVALLAAAMVLLVGSWTPAPEPEVPPRAAPRLYVAAIGGRLEAAESGGGGEGVEAWSEVEEGHDLVPGARYRCPAGSMALLRSSTEELEVILNPESSLEIGSSEGVEVKLESGSIQVHWAAADGDRALPVEAGGRSVGLLPPCSVILALDGGLRLAVYDGEATVGDRLLSAGTMATVGDEGIEADPEAVLPAPRLLSPMAGSVLLRVEGTPLDVDFAWRGVEGARGYLIEISNDLLFWDRHRARATRETSYSLDDVSEGRYFWRVRATGGPAAFSEPLSFLVRTATNPQAEIPSKPELRIESIQVQSNLVAIRGMTEPGARVRVRIGLHAGSEVQEVRVNPDGSFRHHQQVGVRGELTVVVEAFFRQDNVVTRTRTVYVDF